MNQVRKANAKQQLIELWETFLYMMDDTEEGAATGNNVMAASNVADDTEQATGNSAGVPGNKSLQPGSVDGGAATAAVDGRASPPLSQAETATATDVALEQEG